MVVTKASGSIKLQVNLTRNDHNEDEFWEAKIPLEEEHIKQGDNCGCSLELAEVCESGRTFTNLCMFLCERDKMTPEQQQKHYSIVYGPCKV